MRQPSARPVASGKVALICCVLGVMAVVLSFCGCASSGYLKGAQVAFTGVTIADADSTNRAVAAGHREANPLMRNGIARVVLKSAAVAVVLYAGREIEKRGGGTLAKVMTTVAAAAVAVVAGHNYTVARQR